MYLIGWFGGVFLCVLVLIFAWFGLGLFFLGFTAWRVGPWSIGSAHVLVLNLAEISLLPCRAAPS